MNKKCKDIIATAAEVKRLAKWATPEPWFCDVSGWVYRNANEPGTGIVDYWDKQGEHEGENPYHPHVVCFDTLNFVAHVRTAAPALADFAEKVGEWAGQKLHPPFISKYHQGYFDALKEIRALLAEGGDDE